MAKKSKKSAKAAEPELAASETGTEPARESEALVFVPTGGVEDPLGEPADGEGRVFLGDQDALDEKASNDAPGDTNLPALDSDTESDAAVNDQGDAEAAAEIEEVDEEAAPEPVAPAKLERLQKILSQAGIASRRRAEELITEGRVQVNGTTVTELGTKADPARDHIRVDGKLLHGAERHRYFVLNKPKGYVTTVSDPEGRPTVMTFFEKMRERLYPVGRLDYMSEGLLLVTNDGELANLLTKAGSGVEKTYLVKVSGQPSEDELDKLRDGVAIDREQPGSGKVHTAPARIRQVRHGDNPWYEVVLIEGRNRELRKMFSSIGHFVEKIRRVGYGPLVLDLEPGKLRELEPEELAKLRLAAEGKWHAAKPKEIKAKEPKFREFGRRERGKPDFSKSSRPERPRFNERRSEDRRPQNRTEGRFERSERSTENRRGDFRPKRTFGGDRQREGAGQSDSRPRRSFGAGKPFRGERQERGEFRPRSESGERSATGRFENRGFRGKPRTGKPDSQKSGDRRRSERPFRSEPRTDRAGRPGAGGRTGFQGRSASGFDRREFEENRFDKPRSPKPPRREFNKPGRRWGTEERPQRSREESERPKFGERGQSRTGGSRPAARTFRPGSRPNDREGGQSQSRSQSRPPARGFSKSGERSGGIQNRSGGGGARRGGTRPGGRRPGGPHPGGPRPGGKRRP